MDINGVICGAVVTCTERTLRSVTLSQLLIFLDLHSKFYILRNCYCL